MSHTSNKNVRIYTINGIILQVTKINNLKQTIIMEVKDTKKVVDMINGELKETIQKGIYNHFGVNTDIHAADCGRGNIVINDSMHDVNDKMTGNKFLRRFISDAYLVGYA